MHLSKVFLRTTDTQNHSHDDICKCFWNAVELEFPAWHWRLDNWWINFDKILHQKRKHTEKKNIENGLELTENRSQAFTNLIQISQFATIFVCRLTCLRIPLFVFSLTKKIHIYVGNYFFRCARKKFLGQKRRKWRCHRRQRIISQKMITFIETDYRQRHSTWKISCGVKETSKKMTSKNLVSTQEKWAFFAI